MEPLTWAVIIVAISIGFFVHAVAGFAAALTSLPFLLLVLELQQAVALLSILFAISSAVLLYQNWREARWRLVVQLGIGIAIGMVIGVWLLVHSPSIILKQVLGAFTLLYVGYTFISHHDIRLFKRLGVLFGLLGGIFSGLFAAGGPPNVIFVNNAVKDPLAARGTIIAALASGNLVRIPLLWRNGLLTAEVWIIAAIVIPFFLAALLLGERVAHKIPKDKLHIALVTLLTISGVNLLIP